MDQKAATTSPYNLVLQTQLKRRNEMLLFSSLFSFLSCFLLLLAALVCFFRFTSLNKDDPFELGSKNSEYILTVYFDEINFFFAMPNVTARRVGVKNSRKTVVIQTIIL